MLPKYTFFLLLLIPLLGNAQLRSFPTAEGYGSFTVGGRGGAVYEVTNLSDDGQPGSLRYAVNQTGPRTVVFRVSGTITLNSNLSITKPYITIAGQTAPGDGICIKKYQLSIDADQVIIRYLRVRLGDESGAESDAMGSRYRKNIIIDHVSSSWSVDETMSIYHCDSITIQWCIVSESMYNSNHIKGAHGFGGIWGANYSSLHHNLFAHHSSRNPRFASGCGNTDYRNNVLYNWGYNSCYGGEAQQVGDAAHAFTNINMVANYYKPGPATQPGEVTYRIANPSYRTVKTDYGKWYISENTVVGNAAVTANNWNNGVQPSGGRADTTLLRLTQPWPAMPINQQSAADAYNSVLNNAGARLPKLDAVDTRIISNTRNGNATFEGPTYKQTKTVPNTSVICGMIDSQTDVGGWPVLNSLPAPVDTDHDGMPDAWEMVRGLNPSLATDRNNYNVNGYTNLENYLNGDSVVARGIANTCVSTRQFTATNSGVWLHAKDTASSILISTDTLNLFASVKDNGNYGTFTASYYTTSTTRLLSNNKPLLNRNVTIVPTTPAAITAPIPVRIYFTVAEYNTLKAADASLTSLADLRVLRRADNTCTPSVSGYPDVYKPTASGTFGTYSDGYFVEFLSADFGTFFIAGPTAVLPLKLLSINASVEDKKAKVNWQTTNEINTKNFVVEKSKDAREFTAIGSVDARGNGATVSNYFFVDVNGITQLTYYRLKIFDKDGSFHFSPIVKVDAKEKSLFGIYPNPANETIIVNHPKMALGASLKIIDTNGNLLKQLTLATGVGQTLIDVKSLPAGVYVMVFAGDSINISAKLIKN